MKLAKHFNIWAGFWILGWKLFVKYTQTCFLLLEMPTFVDIIIISSNALSANPRKMVKHTQTVHRQFANELFEYVWPFYGVGD